MDQSLQGPTGGGPVGPAALEGREPAVVAGKPSDEKLLELAKFHCVSYTLSDGTVVSRYTEDTDIRSEVLSFARAVLALADHQPAPPADGEVGELVAWLRETGRLLSRRPDIQCRVELRLFDRAADLLEQRQAAPPAKVPATGLAAELVAWLNDHAINCEELGRADWAERCRVSADLLERQAAPVPVAALGSDYREPWDMSSEDGSQCFASAILSRLVGVDAADEADARWLAAYLQANSRPQHFQPAPVPVSERLPGLEDCDGRDPECVERWPDCFDGGFHPSCCRFPKSCSCGPHALPLPAGEVK